MVWTVIAGVLAVALVVLACGVASNRPPLLDPPGMLARLAIYLSSNVAETGPRPRLAELGPVYLAGDAAALVPALAAVCRDLGWRNVTADARAGTVSAQVVTALLRFTDDVHIRLVPAGDGTVEARVRSASRVGRGDLGANARHVMDLRAALARAGLLVPSAR